MKKLEDLAEVMVGQIMTRVASKDEEGPEVRVLVPGAVEAGYIDEKSLGTNHLKKEFNPKFYTKAGDLVMKLTADYDVALIGDDQEGIAISSFIAVIRSKDLDPKYLMAMLNSFYIKEQLRSKMEGAIRPMLNVSDIRNLAIPFLGKKEQKTLGEVFCLGMKSSKLHKEIAENKEEIVRATIDNAILEVVSNER